MRSSSRDSPTSLTSSHMLLAYVADLELEVDRLRKQSQFIQHESREALKQIQLLCAGSTLAGPAAPPLNEIDETAKELVAVLRDLQEPPGYHPAHDQVVALAVRPLVEQVFRWEQRLQGAPQVVLRQELESEYVEWFPARLRHILHNLLANALKYRDPSKEGSWVCLRLRISAQGYELQISDNGQGLPADERAGVFELLYRATPARVAGLSVGLAVVRMLVEQSGGSLTVESSEGEGTTFVAVLPRYEVHDFLI